MEEKSVPMFKNAYSKYKQTNDIDKWSIHMFNKIMDKIEKESNVNDVDDFR